MVMSLLAAHANASTDLPRLYFSAGEVDLPLAGTWFPRFKKVETGPAVQGTSNSYEGLV
eukprot:SAG31_NODE_28131_length_415_cov_0.655063_1_plen_58_part_10